VEKNLSLFRLLYIQVFNMCNKKSCENKHVYFRSIFNFLYHNSVKTNF